MSRRQNRFGLCNINFFSVNEIRSNVYIKKEILSNYQSLTLYIDNVHFTPLKLFKIWNTIVLFCSPSLANFFKIMLLVHVMLVSFGAKLHVYIVSGWNNLYVSLTSNTCRIIKTTLFSLHRKNLMTKI